MCQILFKLVFISHCYHESQRGERFLKHSLDPTIGRLYYIPFHQMLSRYQERSTSPSCDGLEHGIFYRDIISLLHTSSQVRHCGCFERWSCHPVTTISVIIALTRAIFVISVASRGETSQFPVEKLSWYPHKTWQHAYIGHYRSQQLFYGFYEGISHSMQTPNTLPPNKYNPEYAM